MCEPSATPNPFAGRGSHLQFTESAVSVKCNETRYACALTPANPSHSILSTTGMTKGQQAGHCSLVPSQADTANPLYGSSILLNTIQRRPLLTNQSCCASLRETHLPPRPRVLGHTPAGFLPHIWPWASAPGTAPRTQPSSFPPSLLAMT